MLLHILTSRGASSLKGASRGVQGDGGHTMARGAPPGELNLQGMCFSCGTISKLYIQSTLAARRCMHMLQTKCCVMCKCASRTFVATECCQRVPTGSVCVYACIHFKFVCKYLGLMRQPLLAALIMPGMMMPIMVHKRQIVQVCLTFSSSPLLAAASSALASWSAFSASSSSSTCTMTCQC